MKKFFATILFSVIVVVSFGQSKTFTIIDNKVYEISYNESGQKIYTELGALEGNRLTEIISDEGGEITTRNYNTPNAWKFSVNVTADYCYDIPEDDDYSTYSIGGMLSIGGKYKDNLYLGLGTGVINTTLKIDNNKYEMDCNYCSIPIFAELNLNTKSDALTTQLYGNLKIGYDVIANERYRYDGYGIFTTRLSGGLMIADHVMLGVTYKLQVKDNHVCHGIGASLSYRF